MWKRLVRRIPLAASVLLGSILLGGVGLAGVENKSFSVTVAFDDEFSFDDCFTFDDAEGFCSEESLVGSYSQTDFAVFGFWSINASLKVQAVGIHIFGIALFAVGTQDGTTFTMQGVISAPCPCDGAPGNPSVARGWSRSGPEYADRFRGLRRPTP